jgi:hypothetical protein
MSMQKDAIQICARPSRPVHVAELTWLEPMGNDFGEQLASLLHGQGHMIGLLHDPVMSVFPGGNHPALHPVGTQGMPGPGLEAAVPNGKAARASRKVKNLGGCGQHDGPDASQSQTHARLMSDAIWHFCKERVQITTTRSDGQACFPGRVFPVGIIDLSTKAE